MKLKQTLRLAVSEQAAASGATGLGPPIGDEGSLAWMKLYFASRTQLAANVCALS